MPKKKTNALKKALKDMDSFVAFLQKEACSKEFTEAAQLASKGPHPSETMLYEYVVGTLNKKAQSGIMDHIALCPACSEKTWTLMKLDKEIDDSITTLAEVPLIEKIKRLISIAAMPFTAFALNPAATRSAEGGRKKG